jgi:tetratricopeptide (TPR) repeat protein
MLFEALTDTSPFGGTTLLELAAQVRSGELPSLRGIDKTISKEIEAVCRVALSKDPAQRYPSATEFAADILASLDGGAVAAFGRQRRAARTRRLVVALSVLALLVAVSAGVLFANRQTEEALPRVRVMPPVERELAAARGFAAQGRIDDAADAYRRALALAPANAVVVEWARAALNSGSVSGAQRALEAFRGDDDSAALELRFRVRVELGDEAGAQALLARFPEGPLRQVRSAALAPLRHEDPAQVYQEAIGTWPEAPVLREELARYQWLERLEPALARRTLRLAWAKGAPSPGSNAILKSMRADAATVPSPNRDLALAFLGRGRRELQMIRRLDDARFRVSAKAPTRDERVARAAEALSHALRLSVPGSRCEALVRSALAALEGTDSEHLDRAWGLLGDHPPTRRLVAARLRARAETGWEQRVLELLATDPHPGARLLVGYAHLSLGEMLEALAPFKQAAGQNRAWVPACVGWAGALDGLGRNEEAKALRERVVLLEHPETEAADQALEKVLKQEDLRRLQPAAMRRAVAERVFVHDPIHPYGRFAVCAREFLGRQRGDLVPLGRAASQSLDVLARLQRSAFGLSDRSAIGRGGDRTVSRLRAYAQTPLAADASAPEFLVHGAMGAWAMEFEQQSALSNSVLWDLGRVLRRDPGETVAYVLRGFVHLRAGHLDQAASDLEIAAEQAPDCSVLVFYQALLAGAKRERAEVVLAYLLRARELNWRVWGESGWRHGAYPELERYSDRRDFKAFWNQVE